MDTYLKGVDSTGETSKASLLAPRVAAPKTSSRARQRSERHDGVVEGWNRCVVRAIQLTQTISYDKFVRFNVASLHTVCI